MAVPSRAFLLSLALALTVAGCAPGAAPAASPSRAVASATAAAPVAPTAAAAAAAPAAPRAPLERATVKMGIVGASSDAAFFVAAEKGYFAAQALDVEPQTFRSAAEMIAPLGAGQLDIGGGNPSPGLYNAIQRGIPIRLVADKGRHSPGHGFEGLVVRQELVDSGRFRDLPDLKGLSVAVSTQGSSGEIVLDGALKRVGLSTRDLDMTVLAFPDMPAALAGGAVDAAMPIEPFLVNVLDKNIAALWKRTDEVSPDFQAAVVLYGPSLVERPDVAQRFMHAYVQAARFYNSAINARTSPAGQELVDILVKSTPIKDRALYERMGLPGLDPDALVNVDTLRATQEWWIDRGMQAERVDLDQAVDLHYARAAASQLGPSSR